MVNYNNGKIYKIEPIIPHEIGEIYYGSTTKKYLASRYGDHTFKYRKSKNEKIGVTSASILFDKYGIENCSIFLVELVPCNSKDELIAKEGYFIRNNKCVNQINPNPSIEERKETSKIYRENNSEKINDYQKIYRENNSEKIKQRDKNYNLKNKDNLKIYKSKKHICECGMPYTMGHKARHEKTKKHLSNSNKLIF